MTTQKFALLEAENFDENFSPKVPTNIRDLQIGVRLRVRVHEFKYDFSELVLMLSIITFHTLGYSLVFYSTGRSEDSGNITRLKFRKSYSLLDLIL